MTGLTGNAVSLRITGAVSAQRPLRRWCRADHRLEPLLGGPVSMHTPGFPSPRRRGASLFEIAVAMVLFVVILTGAMEWSHNAARQGREQVAAQDLSHLADLVEAHVLQNWAQWVTPMSTPVRRLDWAAMAAFDPSVPAAAPWTARYENISAWLVAGTGLWAVVLTEGPDPDAIPVPPPSTPTIRHVGVVSPVRPGVAVGRGFEVGLADVETALGGPGMLTGALVAARALDRPGPLSPYMHAADQTGGAPGHPRAELHLMETDLQMWDEPAETAVFCTIVARWSSASCTTPGNAVDPDSLRGYHVFGVSELDVTSVEIMGGLDLGGTMSISGSVRVPSGPVNFGTGGTPDAASNNFYRRSLARRTLREIGAHLPDRDGLKTDFFPLSVELVLLGGTVFDVL